MIKLAIVGTGDMAHEHAKAFNKMDDVKIVAACDVKKHQLVDFVNTYNIEYSNTSFDELLSSCEVDAISNTTPDSFHKEIAIKSLKNNKHIFSEKPLATNYADALEMYEETTKKKLINMVNFSYRNSSGYQHLAKIVQSGELGSVRHVEAVYYLSWLTSKNQGDWKVDDHLKWRLSTEHGSLGVLGDTGVHIIDFATYPVGRLKKINTFLKTFKDKGEKLGEYVLDANDTFVSMVEFEHGAVGTITSTRFGTGYRNRLDLKIFCDKGAVRINFDDPVSEGNNYEIARDIDSKDMYWEKIATSSTPSNFERFIKSIKTGQNDQPDFKRGAEIQKVLDSCFESAKTNTWVNI